MVSCRLLTIAIYICTSLPCRFSLERAASAAGWQQELAGAAAHTPESEQLGITSFVYRAEHPFHPGRLWQAVAEGSALPPVLRSKGFFWVAARPLLVWQWSTAGSLARTHLRPACTPQGVLRLGDVPSFPGGCLREAACKDSCTRLSSAHAALPYLQAWQKPLRQLFIVRSGLWQVQSRWPGLQEAAGEGYCRCLCCRI